MKATIGGFDGMHVGHQALIKRADFIVVIEKGSNLTPGDDRCEYTTLPCKFYNLNDIKDLSPIEFINILKKLNISKTVVGKDFRFAKNRSGDLTLLKKHFEVESIDEVKIDRIGVHSRIIREFIKAGNIKKANKFLGHTYKIKGTQIKGQGLGSKELVPTININPVKNYLIPKPGVYITLTNKHPSLTFIGVRSTDNNFSIETHILHWEKIGKREGKDREKRKNITFSFPNLFPLCSSSLPLINIEFVEFLRENRKFDNLKDLKKRIQEDIIYAENFYKTQQNFFHP